MNVDTLNESTFFLFNDRIVFVDRFVVKSVAVNNLLSLQEIVLSVFIR